MVDLNNEQIEEIAEKVAAKMEAKVYLAVGRSVIRKLLWLLGFATVAVLYALNIKGIPLPKELP